MAAASAGSAAAGWGRARRWRPSSAAPKASAPASHAAKAMRGKHDMHVRIDHPARHLNRVRRMLTYMNRLGVVLAIWAAACKADAPSGGGGAAPRPAPDSSTVVVSIVYGSEKKTWLEEQAAAFEASKPRTRAGHAIRVDRQAL